MSRSGGAWRIDGSGGETPGKRRVNGTEELGYQVQVDGPPRCAQGCFSLRSAHSIRAISGGLYWV